MDILNIRQSQLVVALDADECRQIMAACRAAHLALLGFVLDEQREYGLPAGVRKGSPEAGPLASSFAAFANLFEVGGFAAASQEYLELQHRDDLTFDAWRSGQWDSAVDVP